MVKSTCIDTVFKRGLRILTLSQKRGWDLETVFKKWLRILKLFSKEDLEI